MLVGHSGYLTMLPQLKKIGHKGHKVMHLIWEWSTNSDSSEKYWFILFVLSLLLWSKNKSQTTIDDKIPSLASPCSRQDLIFCHCSSHPWSTHLVLDYILVVILGRMFKTRNWIIAWIQVQSRVCSVQVKLQCKVSVFLRPLKRFQYLYWCKD